MSRNHSDAVYHLKQHVISDYSYDHAVLLHYLAYESANLRYSQSIPRMSALLALGPDTLRTLIAHLLSLGLITRARSCRFSRGSYCVQSYYRLTPEGWSYYRSSFATVAIPRSLAVSLDSYERAALFLRLRSLYSICFCVPIAQLQKQLQSTERKVKNLLRYALAANLITTLESPAQSRTRTFYFSQKDAPLDTSKEISPVIVPSHRINIKKDIKESNCEISLDSNTSFQEIKRDFIKLDEIVQHFAIADESTRFLARKMSVMLQLYCPKTMRTGMSKSLFFNVIVKGYEQVKEQHSLTEYLAAVCEHLHERVDKRLYHNEKVALSVDLKEVDKILHAMRVTAACKREYVPVRGECADAFDSHLASSLWATAGEEMCLKILQYKSLRLLEDTARYKLLRTGLGSGLLGSIANIKMPTRHGQAMLFVRTTRSAALVQELCADDIELYKRSRALLKSKYGVLAPVAPNSKAAILTAQRKFSVQEAVYTQEPEYRVHIQQQIQLAQPVQQLAVPAYSSGIVGQVQSSIAVQTQNSITAQLQRMGQKPAATIKKDSYLTTEERNELFMKETRERAMNNYNWRDEHEKEMLRNRQRDVYDTDSLVRNRQRDSSARNTQRDTDTIGYGQRDAVVSRNTQRDAVNRYYTPPQPVVEAPAEPMDWRQKSQLEMQRLKQQSAQMSDDEKFKFLKDMTEKAVKFT